jgi:hypothetical protein
MKLKGQMMVGQILKQILIYLRKQMTDRSHEIPYGIAVAGCKIVNKNKEKI